MSKISIKELIDKKIIEEPMDGNHGELHPTAKDYVYTGIPFIMASDLDRGKVNFSSCKYISEETANGLRKGFAKNGDVLLSHKATIGRTALLKGLNTEYAVLTPQVTYYRVLNHDVLCAEYLKYYFDSPEFQYVFNKRAGAGSTRAYLGILQQQDLSIELMDIEKQHKISNVLTAIDDKIENNNKVNAELESMAKTIYDYWFLQFEFPNEDGKPYKSSGGKMVWNEELKREIPEGWEVVQIGKILDKYPKTESVLRDDYEKGNLFPIIDQSKDFICGYTDDKDKVLHLKDAIVFGDHTNFAKYINFDFARGADGTQIVVSKNKNLPNYLLYLQIVSLPVIEQGYSRHFKFLKEQFVFVPNKIVSEKYMKIIEEALLLIKKNIFENRELSLLRDFLLPMLMNGQVGFKD